MFKLEEEREYEQVFYDGLTFNQMLENSRQEKLSKEKEIEEKEKEFEKQLVNFWKLINKNGTEIKRKNKLSVRQTYYSGNQNIAHLKNRHI